MHQSDKSHVLIGTQQHYLPIQSTRIACEQESSPNDTNNDLTANLEGACSLREHPDQADEHISSDGKLAFPPLSMGEKIYIIVPGFLALVTYISQQHAHNAANAIDSL